MIPPSLADALPQAADAVRAAQTIVLACHVNPDGDALGSLLGFALALAPLNKQVTVLSQDGVPDILRFLPGVEMVQKETSTDAFDLAVVLDCGDLARVGDRLLPVIGRARAVVDIDHHVVAGAFGDVRLLNPKAASTAEIVYDLILHMGLPISTDVATCLFTGVITDTGSFRFQNVTPNTLRVAAFLLESGAPPARISENVFENRTFAATALLGHALASLQSISDGQIVWAHITAADFAQVGATDEDTEGVVSHVRGVRGAEVGILFREMTAEPEMAPSVRVSLRSRETVNVAEVAATFGGGGHRMAAGCTLYVPLADAETVVLSAVRAALPAL